MICEKCGSAIPTNSFVCPNCNAIMSKSQIEKQKQFREERRKKITSPEYMSEKYGSKREFILNNDKDYSYIYVVGVIVFILLIVTIVSMLFL